MTDEMMSDQGSHLPDWELMKLQAKALIDGASEICWYEDPVTKNFHFKVTVPENYLFEANIPTELPKELSEHDQRLIDNLARALLENHQQRKLPKDEIRYDSTNSFPEEVWVNSDPSEEQEKQHQRLVDHLNKELPIESRSIVPPSDRSSEEAG